MSFLAAAVPLLQQTEKEMQVLREELAAKQRIIDSLDAKSDIEGAWTIVFEKRDPRNLCGEMPMVVVGTVATIERHWSKIARGRSVLSIEPR